MDVEFVTLDVFTGQLFGGNPLAVIPDARNLSTTQMQAITAEFNYSEATFVLPSEDPAVTARVRIFTPIQEISFSGHPNVGTAVALALDGTTHGQPVGDRILFEEGVGLVGIDILREGQTAVGARFTAPGEITFGPMFEADAIAESVGLPADTIRSDRHLPQSAQLGERFVFAEVSDLEFLRQATPIIDRFKLHLPSELTDSLYLYTRNKDVPDSRIRARVFSPLNGIAEDPATGSAAAILGALIGKLENEAETLTITIEQGIEMGRPSRINVDIQRDSSSSRTIRVSGHAVPVMRGTLTL